MPKEKVFLCGADNVGWALDDDLSQLRTSLDGTVEFVGLTECDVIHSVWWEALLKLPLDELIGKRIVCHASGEPFRYMTLPHFVLARQLVGHWVAQSKQAVDQFSSLGIDCTLIPYAVDCQVFKPVEPEASSLVELRKRWGIPENCYLIGNFHRDTEGADLSSPKLVKGPDLFAEIVKGVQERGVPVHVLLAGPRRFWLKEKLKDYNVPFTYLGEDVECDDLLINRQPQTILNLLYNLLDLYVVSSRSEGGPRSVLEAAAARCVVISTPVGHATDLLHPCCVYNDVVDGVTMAVENYQNKNLGVFTECHYEEVTRKNIPSANRMLFADFYRDMANVPLFNGLPSAEKKRKKESLLRKARSFFSSIGGERKFSVGLWHKFYEPPYGGGNQFMLALRKSLLDKQVEVVDNVLSRHIDAYVINSVQFDLERFSRFLKKHEPKIVHRVDGPIQLIRNCDSELDDLCFELNRKLASYTVIQSNWTLVSAAKLGYKPVNPVIIKNGIDAEIFHSLGRINFERRRKTKLISSSWSDNPRKGGPLYKWIEDNLDWDRYDYTFVGRASETFDKIKLVDPVPSEQLAGILRQHDIYISASQNDPCSNAVIEALACGLPVLYLNDGGHPELVGFGGVPFTGTDDVLSQLEKLVNHYEMFQNLIVVPEMGQVSDMYLSLLKGAAGT